jgi:hypothetical protein
MNTNQMMTIQIGKNYTVQIGHLTKMGSVSQVVEMGNASRKEKGLNPIPLDNILEKQEIWEFVISRNTQIEVELKYGELGDLKKRIKSDYSELKNYKNSSGKIQYGKLMTRFPHLIKSKRGKNGGTWAELHILLKIANSYGLTFKVENEVLNNFHLLDIKARANKSLSQQKNQKVYVLTDGFYYKIGVANNVENRILTLQTGNPHKIKEVFSFSIENALNVELKLHKKFSKKQLEGEWFNLNQSDLKNIKLTLENLSSFERDY